MYLKLKGGLLKEVISRAIKNEGNIRKLSKRIGIPRSTLSRYGLEKRDINESNLKKLENYLKIEIKKTDIIKKIPDNWKQVKGGKNRVENAKKEGTFYAQLEKFRGKSRKGARAWHRTMKKDNPREYYLSQYEKFKKIGGYKYTTKKGEKVRNILEKDTADFLFNNNFTYEYEPLINADKKYFFPDFLINKDIIIECTMWRGYDKAIKLKEKIRHLNKKYKIFVLIPEKLKKYYGSINKNLIFKMEDLKIKPEGNV